jgi:ABC-2 type transport system permease protein
MMSKSSFRRLSNDVAFWAALAKSQLSSSFALRGAFFASALFMLLNDLIFFTTWWLIMARFEHVRGWRLEDVMCLFGISAGGYGLCVIAFGGIRDLSRKIEDGELDALMTQPKSVLLQALASRTQASGWGDVAASVVLFALSGMISASSLPRLLFALACAAVTFAACGIISHSLAFWVNRIGSLSAALVEFTMSFSLYPPALFGGPLKIVLFTLLPAGLVSYLPVELVRRPSLSSLLAAAFGTVLYAAFALCFFARGLRRYASGNRFSARA